MSIVVACGVSAGIAAIFNAPIAGVLFALEIFLRDFSFRSFSPVVFASVISCSIMHALRLEDVAIFEVSMLRGMGYVFVGVELPLFLILGVMCGLAAAGFIKLLYYCEDVTEKLKIPDPMKPALGALFLGVIGYITLLSNPLDQVPLFYGNGYPAIQTILGSDLFLKMSAGGLIILFVLKMLATCLTLGSGGSGGVFAPSLLMGAALGGAFGMALAQWGIIPVSSANVYALVGMASLVAGTTHAPLTAIVMLYEITREPKVILPVMFAAIIATAGTRLFSHDSIYTLKLRRRGIHIGALSDLTVLRRIKVEDVDKEPVHFVHPHNPLKKLIDMASETNATDFVVVDDQGFYQGMVTGQDIRTALLQPEAVSLLVVSELQRIGVPTVTSFQTLDIVLDLFARGDVQSLPIASSTDSSRIEGLITRQAVMRRYQEELDLQNT